MIPISFAADNQTVPGNDADSNQILISNDDSEVLKASNDYYFDASVDEDGDGSQDNPYKYLNASRIKANSNIYLANGKYNLDASKDIEMVNIYGSDVNKTIIHYDGVAFKVFKSLSVQNVTFVDLSIVNSANLTLSNTVMSYGFGHSSDTYGNNYGGAISTSGDYSKAIVKITNCTFENNFAIYGGAIYMGAGTLEVLDSVFLNNMAYSYGGAIACENTRNVIISKSKFYNSVSFDDAGGAIYIKSSTFNANNLEIVNSTATFGGAITTLKSSVSLNSISCLNNSAKYAGGAIYHMYGSFKLIRSNFYSNTAVDGGAIFIDNSTDCFANSNVFVNNSASNCAGAFYSLFNKLKFSIPRFNTFKNNTAQYNDDYYDTQSLNLTIGDGNYTMVKVNDTQVETFPSYYSLIDENQVTPVKNQQASGNCWAFTGIAVLESCLLKATGKSYDLSEENLKNIISLFSNYGWNSDTNDGGYINMVWGYLTSWLGPVNEIDDLFDDKSTLSAVLKSIFHIQNILFLRHENYTDNDEIKEALIKYGAVGVTMPFYNDYYDETTNSYYCFSKTISPNHAVTIVGWDDNYSKSNFKWGSYIEADGAWIVRNSWGPSWGDNGYFYVSYYDEQFAKSDGDDIYTLILNDTLRYDKNYQYDIIGMSANFRNSSSTVWYKNIFTATDNEFLAAVSTYFEKLTNWTVSVNVNGQHVISQSGISKPGYYTINLDKLIPLKTDDVFEVIFNITVDGEANFPISELKYYNNIPCHEGVSFLSYDGLNWTDLYSLSWKYAYTTYTSQIACIKAFTILADYNTTVDLSIEFDDKNPGNITATVKDQFGNLLDTGKVLFNVNDAEYSVNVSNGIARLSYNFFNCQNTVSATFSSRGYNSSFNSTAFNIKKRDLDFDINIFNLLNNVTIDVIANEKLNVSAMLLINDDEHNIVFADGKYSLNLNELDNGNYNVTLSVTFPVESVYNSIVVEDSFSLDVMNTQIIAGNLICTDEDELNYNVTLLDGENNALFNKTVEFIVNRTVFTVLTDTNGQAVLPVKLTAGEYAIEIRFNGDNNCYKSGNMANITIKTKVNIDLTVNKFADKVNITVNVSKNIHDNVTVIVNNKSTVISLVNGLASLNLTDLANGNYTVKVLLNDSRYSFNIALDTFTVNVYDSQIISSDLTVVEGNLSLFNVTLADMNGNPIAGRNVSFRLNNLILSNISDVNGNVGVYFNMNSGIYDVCAVFDGDDSYFKSQASNIIKVKSDVFINLEISKFVNNVSINIHLSKSIDDNLTVVVNNKSNSLRAVDGAATFTLNDLANDIYTIEVLLNDDVYSYNNVSTSIEVNVSKSRIISSDMVVIEGNLAVFNATLFDEYNNPVVNRTMGFSLNNKIFTNVSDDNGLVTLIFKLDYGIYDVYMSFEGDDSYFKSKSSNVIKVKRPIGISVSQITYQNSADIYVSVSNTVPLINISVNGEDYLIKDFNSRNFLLNNLSNGIYFVNVNIADDELYYYVPLLVNFTIDVKNTEILSDDLITYYKSGNNFTVTLKDDEGNLLVGNEIQFNLNNQNYTVVSDSEGKASISLYLPKGDYPVYVRSIGNANYYGSDALFNIHVETTIQANDSLTKTYGAQYSVLFLDQYGNPLKLSKITFILNNVKYDVISDENGYASLGIFQNTGTYILNIINNLNGESVTKIIKVLPRIAQNNDMSVYAFSKSIYKIRIFGDNGNPAGADERVLIKFNGQTKTLKTDKNGYVSYKLPTTVKPKTYTITATYNGQTVKNTVKINSIIKAKNIKAKKTKTLKVKVSLKKVNGKYLSGKKIKLKFKGKTYKAKTNKKGIVTFKIPKKVMKKLKKGKKYTYIVTYGNDIASKKIAVKK